MKNEKLSLQRKQLLQSQGDVNTKIYFVEEGLLRSYLIDSNGKEHTYMFSPSGWYIGDSNPPETKCQLFIEALEPSVVIPLDKQVALEQQEKMTLVNRIARLQERVLMLMSSSIIDRYHHFLELYPDLSQRVPQHMIASYLGVTPEALSKVKGDTIRNRKS
ncbi:Crp/Fnr family transcriptional regulator [Aquimarina sp. U1-2]|nr:Crp/Fnr family transcriptional regulator [Aquimarina sp. U1-2]